MNIVVAGATGAIGRRLIPMAVQAGHAVVAMTRSQAKADAIRAAGGEPVVADAFDEYAVMTAGRQAKPEVVVHQWTAIPPRLNLRRFDREFALTNQLRTEGTRVLIAAASAAGARRLVAQSFAGWSSTREGGPVKTEEDPVDLNPRAPFRRTLESLRDLETTVLTAPHLEGLVLRYGAFYGPGTSLGGGGPILDEIRQRRLPIVGRGTGVWSFIHIDDAARATLAAIERGIPGVYNIVDDQPAPVSTWLPALAAALGAKPPRHVPRWIGWLAGGEAVLALMTEVRGASNVKAKRELAWHPEWATWRDGFRRGLAASSAHDDLTTRISYTLSAHVGPRGAAGDNSADEPQKGR
jgi:nucleoside-diphosphate-sugar epimerase